MLRLPDGMGRCVPCNKVFKYFSAGKKHYEVKHAVQCAIIECCYCHKRFNKYSFRTHLNTVHGVVGVKNVVELYGKVVDP